MSRICWASLAESSGTVGFAVVLRSGTGGGTGDGGFVMGAEGGCNSEVGSLNMGGGGGGVDVGSGRARSTAEAAADGVSREVELAELLVSPSPMNV